MSISGQFSRCRLQLALTFDPSVTGLEPQRCTGSKEVHTAFSTSCLPWPQYGGVCGCACLCVGHTPTPIPCFPGQPGWFSLRGGKESHHTYLCSTHCSSGVCTCTYVCIYRDYFICRASPWFTSVLWTVVAVC